MRRPAGEGESGGGGTDANADFKVPGMRFGPIESPGRRALSTRSRAEERRKRDESSGAGASVGIVLVEA
jgi:hypothetical protein